MSCVPVTPASATEYQNKLHSCRERSYLRTQKEKRKILCLRGQKAAFISSTVDYICPCSFWLSCLQCGTHYDLLDGNGLSPFPFVFLIMAQHYLVPVKTLAQTAQQASLDPICSVIICITFVFYFLFALEQKWDMEVRYSGSHLSWKAETAQWFPEQPVLVKQQQ